MLGPAEVRRLAERLGLRPTKRLGQNFVHDANTVRRIARLAALTPDDVVLEIGPGLGSLTLALLADEPAARVLAVEIDPRLAAALPETVAARYSAAAARLTVLTLDALALRPVDLPAALPPPTVLVANLPYNVGVPVLLTILERLPSVRHGLVMVQAEVVDRLAAPPGSRAYGAPSAKLAWYARARRAGPVPRAVFWPVPGVDSALLAFTRRDPPAPGGPDGASDGPNDGPDDGPDDCPNDGAVAREVVFALVDEAFAQRRKALRSALAGHFGSTGACEKALLAAGIDPMTRAEQLTVADFARIAREPRQARN
ncbi:MAG: 16S rRNA (adenine(1518)-N(6)/adenine(1519)-N(6))-dimethyltransferase RsmA [Pseudonocardia sp.]